LRFIGHDSKYRATMSHEAPVILIFFKNEAF
jgi:hypothetical protein